MLNGVPDVAGAIALMVVCVTGGAGFGGWLGGTVGILSRWPDPGRLAIYGGSLCGSMGLAVWVGMMLGSAIR
jgi:hypothetical protein